MELFSSMFEGFNAGRKLIVDLKHKYREIVGPEASFKLVDLQQHPFGKVLAEILLTYHQLLENFTTIELSVISSIDEYQSLITLHLLQNTFIGYNYFSLSAADSPDEFTTYITKKITFFTDIIARIKLCEMSAAECDKYHYEILFEIYKLLHTDALKNLYAEHGHALKILQVTVKQALSAILKALTAAGGEMVAYSAVKRGELLIYRRTTIVDVETNDTAADALIAAVQTNFSNILSQFSHVIGSMTPENGLQCYAARLFSFDFFTRSINQRHNIEFIDCMNFYGHQISFVLQHKFIENLVPVMHDFLKVLTYYCEAMRRGMEYELSHGVPKRSLANALILEKCIFQWVLFIEQKLADHLVSELSICREYYSFRFAFMGLRVVLAISGCIQFTKEHQEARLFLRDNLIEYLEYGYKINIDDKDAITAYCNASFGNIPLGSAADYLGLIIDKISNHELHDVLRNDPYIIAVVHQMYDIVTQTDRLLQEAYDSLAPISPPVFDEDEFGDLGPELMGCEVNFGL